MIINKPIIVSGSHRSGSTWVGDVIAANVETQYYHEPFNPTLTKRKNPIVYWFDYVKENPEKEMRYKEYIDSIVGINNFRIRHYFSEYQSGKIALREFIGMCISPLKKRSLIKDPIAVFSLEWLHENYNADMIVLWRNPLAFMGSLKVKNWKFDFNHIKEQKKLVQEYFPQYSDEINNIALKKWDELTVMECGMLQWKLIHHVILLYMKKYPYWIYKRHEDLSLNPLQEFKDVFDRIHLDFNNSVKSKIAESTSGNSLSELKRNSAENINSWRERLTDEEVHLILDYTKPVAIRMYPELYN